MSKFLTGITEINVTGPKIVWSFNVAGVTINITETIVLGWFVIALITAFVLWITHDMKKVPSKKQAIAELIVTTVNKLVDENMGKEHRNYSPYIATLFSYSILGSLISMLGLRSVTADFNTTITWALITFFFITYSKIKTNHLGGYVKGYFSPIFVMAPLNIISEIATPVSMGFRHFGNIAGGMVITSLIYFALTGLSNAIGLPIPILTVGIPAVLSVYFDLFSGFMQAYIFISLSMAYIGGGYSKEE
ncbi:MAG: F0F1 ATP synthase subunit A [Ruminococcus sp.]|nr:F0F1 ATP synthase subunit A [Ruminococcus sp.]